MTDKSEQSTTAVEANETTHFGFHTVAKEEKVAKGAEVFHSVASKYDIMNDLMSVVFADCGNALPSIVVGFALDKRYWTLVVVRAILLPSFLA